MRIAKLILVDPVNNINRVYNMADIGNGAFEVEMGRQGATLLKKKYPISQWDNLYSKKISEGYIDRVSECGLQATMESAYKPIEDVAVEGFVDYLISRSRKLVESEIAITCEEVSEKMVSTAQDLINKIDQTKDLKEINDYLVKLFAILPRKMKDVGSFLPDKYSEIPDILVREQQLLDAIKIVKKTDSHSSFDSHKKTILEANHLEIKEVKDTNEIRQIKKYLSAESEGLFKRAFRVKNLITDKKFYDYMNEHDMTSDNIHYYYHGSSDANYWGIITEGLSINPQAPITGKMFGYGIYFAPRAKKSIGYTDLSGSYWRGGNAKKAYLAVFKVCYKNQLDTFTCDKFTRINKLKAPYDVLYAHKGVQLYNDEVIIYNESQCTIQYLIELSL